MSKIISIDRFHRRECQKYRPTSENRELPASCIVAACKLPFLLPAKRANQKTYCKIRWISFVSLRIFEANSCQTVSRRSFANDVSRIARQWSRLCEIRRDESSRSLTAYGFIDETARKLKSVRFSSWRKNAAPRDDRMK